jgi:hypothetical protein
LKGLLFAPSSLYPRPVAYLVAADGSVQHTWSHPLHQPGPEHAPPNYLRGWNHVEVDRTGHLYAIVPLQALLKLTADSQLAWASEISAHHDLAIREDGSVLVLTESPRLVRCGDSNHLILDNQVTNVGPIGSVRDVLSVYDVLRTEPALAERLEEAVRQRAAAFQRSSLSTTGDEMPEEEVTMTRELLRTGRFVGERRQALRRLRDLPGSPCDVLHTNTLEILARHPSGLWQRGDVLLCMRELDLIVVVDLVAAAVRWWWGPEELSGPHQPSMLPDGRVLIFDNGRARRRSRLLLVEPVSREVVWQWTASPPQSFFCPVAGGCERLANGNLLVTDAQAGAAFELTMSGRKVWALTLPKDVFGQERGRVSIYRMSSVSFELADSEARPSADPLPHGGSTAPDARGAS